MSSVSLLDEQQVRGIVADLMEDVVVAKPDDPIAFLLEMLQSNGKKAGDAALSRSTSSKLSRKKKKHEYFNFACSLPSLSGILLSHAFCIASISFVFSLLTDFRFFSQRFSLVCLVCSGIGLNEILATEEKGQVLSIAKHFPQYRRQIKDALDKCDGTIDDFKSKAKEALSQKAGPTSI